MKLKDIVQRALILLGKDEGVNESASSPILNKLKDCANTIYEELVLQYIDLKKREKIKFENGRCYYSDFKYRVKEILSLEKNHNKLQFKVYPQFIYTDESGEIDVTYLYYLSDLELEDEIIVPHNITLNILGYGVVAEYYYRQGLLDEGLFFRNRYDGAIDNLTKKLRNGYIARKKFIR